MNLSSIANFFRTIDRAERALEKGASEDYKRCLEDLEKVDIPMGRDNREKLEKLKRELIKKTRFKVIK